MTPPITRSQAKKAQEKEAVEDKSEPQENPEGKIPRASLPFFTHSHTFFSQFFRASIRQGPTKRG